MNDSAIRSSRKSAPLFTSRRDALAVSLAGGVMMGVAFPPIGFWPLAWGSMIPLFLAAGSLSRDRVFLHGLAFFAPAFGIPFHWVALHRMATPAIVLTIALIAVAACAAAVVALVADRGRRDRPAARIIAAAACLLLFEQALIHGPVPFPSVVSGYAMADAVWLDPVLRIAGLSGVSFILVGISAGAASLVAGLPPRRARHLQALLVLGAFAAGWLYGPLPTPDPSDEDTVFRATLVQPALEPEAWANVSDPERISALERRVWSLVGLLDVDDPGLIILPETALPAPALQAAGSTPEEWTRRWANRLGAPLLAGVINPVQALADEESGREGSYTNSAIVAQPYAPEDADVSRYDKEILVPFAERVPFANVVPALGALSVPAGGVERYVNGSLSAPLTVDGVEVGILICFESLFPQLARRRLRAGADILVVLTQDGWWRSNAARRQHLLFSRMRSVETGRPLVQVSVDGESGVFDQRGRLRVVMDSGVPAAQTVDIPLVRRRTLYGATGDTPVHILIIVLLTAATVRMFTPGPTGAHPQPESATGP